MLTVEQAKQALIDETGAAAWERWLPKLDAYAAAVRAENAQTVQALQSLVDMYGPSEDYSDAAQRNWQRAEAVLAKDQRPS